MLQSSTSPRCCGIIEDRALGGSSLPRPAIPRWFARKTPHGTETLIIHPLPSACTPAPELLVGEGGEGPPVGGRQVLSLALASCNGGFAPSSFLAHLPSLDTTPGWPRRPKQQHALSHAGGCRDMHGFCTLHTMPACNLRTAMHRRFRGLSARGGLERQAQDGTFPLTLEETTR